MLWEKVDCYQTASCSFRNEEDGKRFLEGCKSKTFQSFEGRIKGLRRDNEGGEKSFPGVGQCSEGSSRVGTARKAEDVMIHDQRKGS